MIFDKLNFQEKPIKKTGQAKRTEPHVKGGQALGNFFSVFESGVGDVNGMIIPNWSVFKTLRWLRDNTSDNTEEWGDSYYFYQTCMDGFKFHSIESMRKIIDLGFDRILTSGGKNNVMDGIEFIEKLVDKTIIKVKKNNQPLGNNGEGFYPPLFLFK